MRSLSFAPILALAVGASAFLIPSSISADGLDLPESFIDVNRDAGRQVLRLDCSDCLYAQPKEHGEFEWVDNVANSLVLKFDVRRPTTNYPDTLILNGVPIYPIRLGVPEPLTANQLPRDTPTSNLDTTQDNTKYPNLRLSYTVEAHDTPVTTNEHMDTFADIKIHILAINDQAVNVDTVRLTVVTPKDPYPMQFHLITEPKIAEVGGSEQNAKCTKSPLICKFEAIFKNKLNALKASTKHLKDSVKGTKSPIKGCAFSKEQWEKIKSGTRPHGGFGQHFGKSRHHRHQSLRRVFSKVTRVFVHVVIPICIGIAAGITASLFGMALGHLMVICWFRLKRGGKKNPYTSVEHGETMNHDFFEEKHGLMADDHLPEYEHVEIVTVVDEKGHK